MEQLIPYSLRVDKLLPFCFFFCWSAVAPELGMAVGCHFPMFWWMNLFEADIVQSLQIDLVGLVCSTYNPKLSQTCVVKYSRLIYFIVLTKLTKNWRQTRLHRHIHKRKKGAFRKSEGALWIQHAVMEKYFHNNLKISRDSSAYATLKSTW